MKPPDVRFTAEDAERANAEWRFNCGPASICAIAGLTPEQVRPHLGDFAQRGYMNPTQMFAALTALGIRYTCSYPRPNSRLLAWPNCGIARVQWGGPWTQLGVPPSAAYQHTHWVAAVRDAYLPFNDAEEIEHLMVCDVNALDHGGWRVRADWNELARSIMARIPKSSGWYWLTHAIEVQL